MRITNQMKRTQMMIDLERLQTGVYDAQRVLNTGKEVSKPSDDPIRSRRIMLLRSSEARRNQNLENISDGVARLSYSESQLRVVDDMMTEARTIAIKGSNGATNDKDREDLALRVDQLLHEVFTVANSRFEDQYVFGGFNTQEAPYQLVTDPVTGDTIGVQAQALHMEGEIMKVTADGEKVKANVNGTDVFQTGAMGDDGDMFQVLIDLRDALRDGVSNDNEQDPPVNPGDPPWTEPEYDSLAVMQDAIDRIDVAQERVRSEVNFVGGSVKRLMNTESRHRDIEILESEHMSQAQDADLTKWITEFQMQTIALQQAMEVGSQVLRSSLVNFIR